MAMGNGWRWCAFPKFQYKKVHHSFVVVVVVVCFMPLGASTLLCLVSTLQQTHSLRLMSFIDKVSASVSNCAWCLCYRWIRPKKGGYRFFVCVCVWLSLPTALIAIVQTHGIQKQIARCCLKSKQLKQFRYIDDSFFCLLRSLFLCNDQANTLETNENEGRTGSKGDNWNTNLANEQLTWYATSSNECGKKTKHDNTMGNELNVPLNFGKWEEEKVSENIEEERNLHSPLEYKRCIS